MKWCCDVRKKKDECERQDQAMMRLPFVKEADVQLITQDGHSIGANRSLLAADSPFFHAIFFNGRMQESLAAASAVRLPSISAAALLPLLEHLHTGRTFDLSVFPISVDNATLVFRAADFCLARKLQSYAAHVFSTHIQWYSVDWTTSPSLPQSAAKYLSEAVDMSRFVKIDNVLAILVQVMSASCGSIPLHAVRNLSAGALRCYLEEERATSMSMRFTTSEYARLRCVILWCACCLESVEAQDALIMYLPYLTVEQSGALSFFRISHRSNALLEKLDEFKELLSSFFRPWLPFLDLYRVEPDILKDVIHPLGIVPPSYIAHIFRFHALYADEMRLLCWKHDDANRKLIIISDEGHVVEIPFTAGASYARAEMLVARTMEWDFVIEETCGGLVIGFCTEEQMSMGPELIREAGYGLHCSGHLCHGAEDRSRRYCERLRWSYRVRVHVDMERRTCRFSTNGTTHGVAWENIPDRLYPAILAFKFPARVRIEAACNQEKGRLIKDLAYVASPQEPFTVMPWRNSPPS